MNKSYWGEEPEGIVTNFKPNGKEVVLTLDLCGSFGDSLDYRIIDAIKACNARASVFVSSWWITLHPILSRKLKQIPNLDIQNHGYNHVPASVSGRSIYSVKGTRNKQELMSEVLGGANRILKKFSKDTSFYRSGAAYYDMAAIQVINKKTDHEVAGFSILGDAGCSYTAKEAFAAISQSKAGDIIIAHANHPERDSGLGVAQAITELANRNYKISALSDIASKRFIKA